MYPNLSGRFATFVGIEFSWDYTKKPNQRILANTVKINGEPLKFNRIYTIAMHGFISKGGDGYTSFKGCEIDKQNYEKNNLTLINNWLNVNHEEW
jgi:2',3'-cyclic-nucleotide 2'-phosphodiesterase (5'-nucleotidase family)